MEQVCRTVPDHLPDKSSPPSATALGDPSPAHRGSWKDIIAILVCMIAFMVAVFVVFVTRVAVYFGQDGQFIWVGLCLTVMGWCAQYTLRRAFLILATNTRASTIQTLDAVLRSDPFADHVDWIFRALLILMLAVTPGLSVAYKSLGGGTARHQSAIVQVPVGLTGPPGTQNIGFGLSQFVNATLPWFEGKGGDRQVYGFNTYTPDRNTAVILDSPMPGYLSELRESLDRYQTTYLTGPVTALVCALGDNAASLSADELNYLMDNHKNNDENYANKISVWHAEYLFIGIMFPNIFNNTDIYYGAWDEKRNETFGQKAQHYEMWRQMYRATWHITHSSIELKAAIAESKERVSDGGVFTNNRVSPVKPFGQALVEFDTHFRDRSPSRFLNDYPEKKTRSAAVPLALMVWARMVAWYGPETWGQEQPQPSAEQMALLRYDEMMVQEIESVVIKRGWKIAVVLVSIPLLALASLAWRVLLHPVSPIGEGFGIVTILASVDVHDLSWLKNAGYAGKLKRSLNVGISSSEVEDDAGSSSTGKLTTRLGVETLPITDLVRGKTYT